MNVNKRVIFVLTSIIAIGAMFVSLYKFKNTTPGLEDKIKILSTSFGFPIPGHERPIGALNSAGYNAGLPKFNIPPLQEVDSGMGIANPGNLRKGDNATALPSTLLIASTFSKEQALIGGNILGREAKDKGFNIVLAGGVNLIRESRNGRNFEYSSEDPLLSGIMTGYFVKGIQNNNVISTLKHFAFNSQETGRVVLNALIDEKAARESDLLAFEISNQIGHPGAVMTAYNKVNGTYSSENEFLINQVLKKDWKFNGWVMSDWGGTHSTEKAVFAGLDQQSGYQYDDSHFFGKALLDAVKKGIVTESQIDDMFYRIVNTLHKCQVFTNVIKMTNNDYEAHRTLAQKIAEKGIVLLKNNGILPLSKKSKYILVIGGNADKGVLSGAGASQVIPPNSIMLRTKEGTQVYHPSSIIESLKRVLPDTSVSYELGDNLELIKDSILNADTIIIVANQWGKETKDHESLDLPGNQGQLISSVAQMNKNVVVVLQTGGPVKMPWQSTVKGIVEAWYPGIEGGQAIANILTGIINPSAKLPVTFPENEFDLPRPIQRDWSTTTSSPKIPKRGYFDVNYNIEGSNVGYKWFYKYNKPILYPFGFGLSYTKFSYDDFSVVNDKNRIISIRAVVKNEGSVAGIDTPQIYLYGVNRNIKLISWAQIDLRPGEKKTVDFELDPKLLSEYDVKSRAWIISSGKYSFCMAKFAGDCTLKKTVNIDGRTVLKYK